MKKLAYVIAGVLALWNSNAGAQPKAQKSIAIKAEQLASECASNRSKAETKYQGRVLRVTGTVGDMYDDILYLPVKVKGEEVLICIRFGGGNKPAVSKGDTATFEGKFDRVAVLGPALVDCKLVSKKNPKK
jgi:hypothetical protein